MKEVEKEQKRRNLAFGIKKVTGARAKEESVSCKNYLLAPLIMFTALEKISIGTHVLQHWPGNHCSLNKRIKENIQKKLCQTGNRTLLADWRRDRTRRHRCGNDVVKRRRGRRCADSPNEERRRKGKEELKKLSAFPKRRSEWACDQRNIWITTIEELPHDTWVIRSILVY